ncbi:MAG: hypothetical protein WDO24_04080 [Pseudomonadota bacterium]
MFSLYDLQPDLPPIIVIDVGAFDSDAFPPPFAGLVAAGHAHVIGFEPDAQGCAELNAKYGPPHRFLPLFVGTGAPARFHRTMRPDTGSLFPPNLPVLDLFANLAENMMAVDVTDVQTTRPRRHRRHRRRRLHQDRRPGQRDRRLQGRDPRAGDGRRDPDRGRVRRALSGPAPVRRYRPASARRRILVPHLCRHGVAVDEADPRRRSRSRLESAALADAVYTRSPLHFATLTPEKLRKLAVVSHDIYRSYDLAYLCLTAADARDSGTLAQRYLSQLTLL